MTDMLPQPCSTPSNLSHVQNSNLSAETKCSVEIKSAILDFIEKVTFTNDDKVESDAIYETLNKYPLNATHYKRLKLVLGRVKCSRPLHVWHCGEDTRKMLHELHRIILTILSGKDIHSFNKSFIFNGEVGKSLNEKDIKSVGSNQKHGEATSSTVGEFMCEQHVETSSTKQKCDARQMVAEIIQSLKKYREGKAVCCTVAKAKLDEQELERKKKKKRLKRKKKKKKGIQEEVFNGSSVEDIDLSDKTKTDIRVFLEVLTYPPTHYHRTEMDVIYGLLEKSSFNIIQCARLKYVLEVLMITRPKNMTREQCNNLLHSLREIISTTISGKDPWVIMLKMELNLYGQKPNMEKENKKREEIDNDVNELLENLGRKRSLVPCNVIYSTSDTTSNTTVHLPQMSSTEETSYVEDGVMDCMAIIEQHRDSAIEEKGKSWEIPTVIFCDGRPPKRWSE